MAKKKTFWLYRGAFIWNQYPENLREYKSLKPKKSKLNRLHLSFFDSLL